MQSLNKKYYKHFQKSMILKASKKKNLAAFLWVKLFVENLRECKKQYLKNQTKDLII